MLVFGNLLLGNVISHKCCNFTICVSRCMPYAIWPCSLLLRPIFSTDDMNSDKHKMERFLHAGRFSVASIYAPISFPPLPLIVLKSAEGSAAPAIAAVGSLRSIDPDRIILKKIVLTGYEFIELELETAMIVRNIFHLPVLILAFVTLKCRMNNG